MKHRQDVLIKCPYYKGEEKQKIFCEGVQDGTRLHLTFSSDPKLRDYKTRYCKGQYNDCLLAKMLNGKWGYDGK